MGGYNNFYSGADYGLEKKYDEFLNMEYKTPASGISLATDARTANQIKTTTEKLNTGAKAIEVQMTMANVAEAIPNQHLEELNRLRKLIGAEFTVHGALVEPTGVTKQGWDDTHRQQAERQLWVSLERAHKLNPDGNIVVTFHSSNGLPEPETLVPDKDTGQPKSIGMMVVDERSGQFTNVSPKENYLTGQPADPMIELKKTNKDSWTQQLSRAAYAAQNGQETINKTMLKMKEDGEEKIPEKFKDMGITNLYKMTKTEDGQKFIEENSTPSEKQIINSIANQMNYGEIYVKEAYNDLQNLFNQAYSVAERTKNNEDLSKLNKFKNEIKGKLNYLDDPAKIPDFAEEVRKGVNLLNTIAPPNVFRPLKEWAIDKASDTFSNLAFKSYSKFKDSSPVISIENPPAGSGLSRAEDIRDLIKETREKFKQKIKEEFGLSKTEAEQQAEKLIGATWDVGHINMIRKFGFDEKALIKQTETIAPYVKNVHLSDNFGMEHTELPMGMGNVPTKAHMDILDKYNKQLKKVVETAQWYQHFGGIPPFSETLAAFGSPIYSMSLSPAWNQVSGKMSGGYFAGYGINPEVHHSIYGAGFSGLPVELGGQIAGRSRFSGTAME